MTSLAEKLKYLRIKKGVTQKECSEVTGISIRTLSRYENGYNASDTHVIKVLADYYGVSVDYLYSGEK